MYTFDYIFHQHSWRWGGSVSRGAGLVIERLQNLGSTSDAVARRCVLGKDTYCCFPPWDKQLESTPCGGPPWRKTCKQNSFSVGVVWHTQSIVQHLVKRRKFLTSSSVISPFLSLIFEAMLEDNVTISLAFSINFVKSWNAW